MEWVKVRGNNTNDILFVCFIGTLYCYCLTDINTEIKEVILNVNICTLREYKLRSGVNWREMFTPKRHLKKA